MESDTIIELQQRIHILEGEKQELEIKCKELHKYQLWFETLSDNLEYSSIYIKDENQRHIYANSTDKRFKGVDENFNVAGKTDKSFYDTITAEKLMERDRQILNGKKLPNHEEELKNKKGEQYYLRTKKIALKDDKGNINGLIGIGHDITEQRRTIDQLYDYFIALSNTFHPQDIRDSSILLDDILQHTNKATNADWASIVWVSEFDKKVSVTDYPKRHDFDHKDIRDNGNTRKIQETKRSLVIEEVKSNKTVNPHTKQTGYKSVAGFPMMLKNTDTVLGVLWLHYESPQEFSPLELKTYQMYANNIAAVHTPIPLLQRLENIYDTIKRLTALAGRASKGVNLDIIVREALDLLGCDIVALFPYDHRTNTFEERWGLAGELNEPNGVNTNNIINKDTFVYDLYNRASDSERGFESQWLADVKSEQLVSGRRFSKAEDIQSLAIIPLTSRQQFQGWLFVNYRERHEFTRNEKDLIATIADLTALSLQNFKWSETQVQVIDQLFEAFKSTGDSKSQLKYLLEAVSKILNEQYSLIEIRILERRKGKDWLVPYVSHAQGKAKDNSGYRLELNQGITGRAATKREPVYVSDVETDPDYIRRMYNTKSEYVIPMSDLYGDLLGVLNLENPAVSGISERDQNMAKAMVKIIGIAISISDLKLNNAQLATISLMGLASLTWNHEIAGLVSAFSTWIDNLDIYCREQTFDKIPSAITHIRALLESVKELQDQFFSTNLTDARLVNLPYYLEQRITKFKATKVQKTRFTYENLCENDVVIQINPWILTAVLLNLVNNAVEAMEHKDRKNKGENRIDFRLISHNEPKDDSELEYVRIEITNTGDPIYPPKVKTLFDLKEYSNSNGKRRHSLGLPVSQLAIQHFKGTIEYDSDYSTGARFIIYLPIHYSQLQD